MKKEKKIKGKPSAKTVLKENATAMPKELARCGMESGVERLRTQLRDAAQDGRTDDSGGDKLEDAAAGGLRRAERGMEQLLKQKKGRPAERRGAVGAEPDSPAHSDTEPPRIKTREAVLAQQPPSAADRQEPQGIAASRHIKTRDTVQAELQSGTVDSTQAYPIRPPNRIRETVQAAPVVDEAPHTGSAAPTVKTKDAYIHRQTSASGTGTPQAAVGERLGARGQTAAKEGALQRRGPIGAAATEPVPQKTMQGEADLSPGQRAVQPQKAVRENSATRVRNSRRSTDTMPRFRIKESRHAVKAAGHPVKAVGAYPRPGGAFRLTTGAVAHARQAASAQQSMTRTRQAARAAGATTQKAAQAAGRALRATLSTARSLAAAIAAGGGVVVMVILVICLIGFLLASPFGLFFSGENSDTGYTMPDAVVLLNGEFSNRIEQIKAANPYDTLDLDNAGSAAMISNWDDVLDVYAVRTSMNADAPEEVATLTEEKLSILREIFWEMNAISYWVEVIPGGEDEEDTTILHITVTVKNYLQMADEYGFTAKQRELLAEMMGRSYQELFMALTGTYRDLTLTPEQVWEIIEKLPNHLSEERRQVVLTAYLLLGKVNYFWGGKSRLGETHFAYDHYAQDRPQ